MRRFGLTALLASTSLSAVGSLFLVPSVALANPQGGSVVAGGASIVQSPATPNRLVINQTSENAVLNWQSFGIGAGQQVIFQQPNAAATALNRVTGNQASEIAGTLTANGQVWLVNPNGVFFGRGAVVNVAGIVATTSDIRTANFMSGNYAFDRPGSPNATVSNAGQITVRDGGLAAFVAPSVANSGVINARLGKVALASGSKFTVDLYGDNLVKFAVDPPIASAMTGVAVDNTGKIKADGGTVTLSVAAAQSLVDHAINVGGAIEARTASMQNGKIVLSGAGGTVTVGGTLDASGQKTGQTGGTVEVLGGAVDLAATAKVNVSGAAGGGTALVGGNFHGAGPQPNALSTTVSAGAVIDADATASGNGGNVAVWSNGTTTFNGSITARGGTQGGDGGHVETSGATLGIGAGAIVNASAVTGRPGTWLLDPSDIEIIHGSMSAGTTATVSNGGNTTTFADNTNGATGDTVTDSSLTAALTAGGSGTTVVVSTTSSGNAAGNGDITVDGTAQISWATGATLMLSADRNIVINSGATISGTAGALTLVAGNTTASGSITLNSAISVNQFSATSGSAGAITLGVAGTAVTTAGGGQSYQSPVVLAANTTVSDTASGAITFASTVDGAFSLAANTAGTTTFGGAIGGTTPLASVATDAAGTTAIDGQVVNTTGVQTYNDAVTLGADATLTSTGAAAAGNITFASTVDGAFALAVDTAGTTMFGGAVGGTTPLASVATDAAGTTAINGQVVNTTGVQTYNDAVILGADATLTSTGAGAAGNVTLAGTVDGAFTLEVDTAGTTMFGGAVGGTMPLASVTTDAVGTTAINGQVVNTTGVQTYNDTVIVGANATLTSTGAAAAGNITFASTVDGAFTLAVNTAGTTTFGGAVGGTTPLASVTSDAAGTTAINGQAVNTTGVQTYNDAVTLGANVTLTSTGSGAAGNVTLAGTVDGAFTLAVDTAGTTIFGGAVGGTTPLVNVTTDAAGATTLDANVTTNSGGQSYGDAVTLGVSVTLSDQDSGAIVFGGTLAGGGNAITILDDHAPSFGGTVSGLSAATLAPLDAANTIAVGDSSLQALTSADTSYDFASTGGLFALESGAVAGTVTIGSNAITGTITTTQISPTLNLALVNGGTGAIGVTGAYDGTGSLALTSGSGGITLSADVTASSGITATAASLTLGADLSGGAGGVDLSQTTTDTLAASVTISATNAAINLGGNVVGSGTDTLTLTPGATGTVSLQTVGNTTAVDALTVTNGDVTLAGTITAGADGVDLSQTTTDTLAAASLTISATNAAIKLGGNVLGAGADTLTLTPGAGGSVSLQAVGNTTAVDALTVTNGAVTFAGNIATGTGGADLSGTTTDTLAANVTISAANAAIKLGGNVLGSGADTLTLTPETGGTVSLQAVGNTTAVNALTVTDGAVTLGGNITTTTGVDLSGTTTDTLAAASLTISANNAAINLGGNVLGSGADTLTLTPGATGSVSLQSVGSTTAVDALTVTDGAVTLNGNIATTTGGADLSGTTTDTLAANITIAATNAAIRLGGNVLGSGTDTLTLTPGATGSVSLQAVGNTTAVDALTVTNGAATLGGAITAGVDGVDLSGTSTDTLAANVTITASNAAIKLGTNVLGSGADTLTLTPGASGSVSLKAVGAVTAVDALTVTNGAATLAGSIATTTGGADLSGTTTDTLAANVTISATNAAIKLGGNVVGSGSDTLTLTPGTTGSVSLQAVGNTTAVDALTVTNGATTINASVTTDGGGQTYGGAVTLAVPVTLTDQGGGTIAFDSTLAGGGNAITIIDNAAPSFGGTVSGLSAATLAPFSGPNSIAVGDSSLEALAGAATSYDFVSTGGLFRLEGSAVTGVVTIGQSTSGGTITMTQLSPTVNLALLTSGTGAIHVTGAYDGTGSLGLTTDGTGAIALTADVTASAGIVATAPGMTLGGNLSGGTGGVDLSATTADTLAAASVTISANDAAIKLPGNILGSGTDTLTLTPGTTGTVLLQAVGNTTAVDALTVTNGTVTLAGNIATTTGGADLSGTTTDTLAAASLTISASNGAIKLGGNVLGAGADTLTLTPGTTGSVSLQAVGNTTAVNALTVTNGAATLGGNITTGAGGADFGGTTTDTLAASVTISAANGAIDLGGNVLGSGADTLTLTPGTTGSVSLQAIGNTTAVDALTVTNGAVTLGGNIATTTGGVDLSATTTDTLAAANVSISASNAAINLGGNVLGAGADTLTLTPGTTGSVTLQAVGNTTAVDALTVTNGAVTLNANIATSTGGADLSGTTTDTLAASLTISATDAAIRLGGNVLGAGADTLTLTPGASGSVSLQAVGNTIAVDALTVTNGTATLAGSIATGSGGADLSGTSTDTLAAASVTISATNAAIKLGGNVLGAGADTLTLTPGTTGTVSLQAVGNTTAVDALTVTNGAVTLNGNIATSAGGADLSGTTTDSLAADVTISASNAAIKLGGNVLGSGTDTLTLTPGATGSVSLQAVGNTTAVDALTVTNGVATLAGNIATSAGGADLSGTTTDTLAASLTISATNAAIKLGGNVLGAGADTLTLTPGTTGSVSLQAVGNTTAVDALTVTNGAATLGGNIATGAGGADLGGTTTDTLAASVTISATNAAIKLGGNVVGSGADTLTLTPGATGTVSLAAVGNTTAVDALTVTNGTATLGGNIATGAGGADLSGTTTNTLAASLTISASNAAIKLGGNVLGSGADTLTLTPGTTGSVSLVDVGNTTAVDALTVTNGTATLGGNIATGAGGADLSGTTTDTLAASLTISATNAAIKLGGNVLGSGADTLTLTPGATGSVSLQAVGNTTAVDALTVTNGTVTLNGNIATSSGGADLSGTTTDTLAANVVISATNAAIKLGGNVLGAGVDTLTLTPGTTGSVSLQTVGNTTAVDALAVSNGATTLDGNVTTGGGGQIYGGAVTLAASVTLIDTGGGAITFQSTLDGSTVGGQTLSIGTTGGTIAFSGNVGSSTPLGALTLTDGELDIGANIGIATSDAAFSQTGTTVLEGGSSTSSTTIVTTGGDIGFSSTIDGTAAGDEALHLNAGTGTITLAGAVGSGFALSALGLADTRLNLSADVKTSGDFSQTGATVLQGGAGATVTTIASSAGDITFSSTIDGDQAGKRALVLAAGAGTIALQGKLGAGTVLGAVTLTDTVLDLALNVGITTSDAAVSQTGTTLLQGGTNAGTTTIATSDGNITFSSTISGTGTGDQSLVLNAGTGTIALQGSLGTGSALGAVTLSDAVLNLSPNIAITVLGAAFSQTGATVLLGNGVSATATTIATSGGNIGFSGTIDGTLAGSQALTLNAGAGTIALSANVGAAEALGAVTFSDGELTLAQNLAISTSGGAFSQTGATLLLGGTNATTTEIDTTAGGSSGAEISFSSAIDGTNAGSQALVLEAGSSGTIALSGAVGASTPLGAVTLNSGGPIDIGDTLTTSGGNIFITSGSTISTTGPVDAGVGGAISLTASGGIDIASPLGATATGAITLDADGGQTGIAADALTINASVGNAHAGPVTLTGAAIALGAAVDGGGVLSIGPSTGAANIGLGGGPNATADQFDVAAAGIADIGSDFTAVSIVTTGGTVHIDNSGTALLFHSPLTIAGAALALDSNLTTQGKAVTLVGPVTLGNSAAIDTTVGGNAAGANITLTGAVAAASAGVEGLTLNAGSGGTIALSGSVGTGTALGAVALTDKTLDLLPNVGIATANASFSETGATVLQGAATTVATANGTIAFSGTIDGTSPGQQALTLNAGTGTITLSGSVGMATPLGAITFDDGALDIAASLGIATSNASFSQGGATVLHGAATTIATSGGMIGFAGAIDGLSSGGNALALLAGAGTITLSGNVGAMTPLGAVTVSGGAVALDASLSGGAIGVTGSSIEFDDTGAGAAVTSTGGQTYAGAITLQAGTSLTDTGGNAIIFQNAIDGTSAGGQALTVSTGGEIALSIGVGSGTALGAVTLSGSVVALDASISGGAVSVTGSTGILFDHAGGGAAVTSTGGQTYTGAVTLQASTSLTDTGGDAVTFKNTIDAASAGAEALSVGTSGGTIALSGAVGSGTALGAVTLSGAFVALDASLTGGAIAVTGTSGISFDATGGGAAVTSTGGQSYTGAVTLLAGTTLTDSGGSAITFHNAIDGAEALSVGTSGGTITLAGNVGSMTQLGAVTLAGAAVDLDASIAGGAINVAGTSFVQFDYAGAGAAVISTGGQTYSGAVKLQSGTSLTDSGGGTIAFKNTIDGANAGVQALAVDASGGTIALSGSVGSGTALAAVTLSAGIVALDASVSGAAIGVTGSTGILFDHTGGGAAVTSTGGQTYSGAITLQAATTLTETGGNAITVQNTIDGAQALDISSNGGSIALSGNVGSMTPLGAVTLSGGAVALDSSISGSAIDVTGSTGIVFDHTGGGAAVASTAGQTYSGPVTLQADTSLTNTGAGTITFQNTIDAASSGAEALSIGAGGGMITLSSAVGATTPLGAVTLSGAVVALDAALSGGAIGVTGSTGILFDHAGAGAAVTSTGGQTYSGAVTLQAATSLTDSGGGTINFQNTIDGASPGGEALSVSTGGGTIALSGNVGSTKPLGAVTLVDQTLVIAPNVGIATAGAAISQSGTTLLAGAAPGATILATSGGAIDFGGTIDGSLPGDQALTLSAGAGTVTLAGSVGAATPLGAVTLTDGRLDLGANVGIATANAPISQSGATVLGGTGGTATTIASTNGTITFAGSIDGTIPNQQALVLSAGTGSIALSANIGAATPLGAVTLEDALLTITGSVEIATGGGAVSQMGASVLGGGAGATTVTVASAGGAIDFAGPIDGSGAGPRSLSLAAGAGTTTLAGSLGGATPLGAVSLTDAVLDLGANAGISTSNAPVSQSGATVLGGTGATTATIATAGGSIAFGGAIDGSVPGDQALILAAGAGTITLAANLGSTTPLGAVTITDGALSLGANVGIATLDAPLSLTGATVLGGAGATATTFATSGGDITISGSLDGTILGDQALALAADTGTIALTGTLGRNTALAALSLIDGALEISANVTIATAAGAFLETGPFVLPGGTNAGTVTIDTTDGGLLPAGANITFTSTIDDSGEGKQALNLTAGAGTVALQGNVGGMTPLGALTMSDGVLDLGANVAITTAGGAVSQTGPTILAGAAAPSTLAVNTTAGGGSAKISFDGAIDASVAGAQALTLAAGAGGTVALLGSVGGSTPLGAISLSGGAIRLGTNVGIGTVDAPVSVAGPVVLLGGASGSTVSIATQGGAIAFSSTIDGNATGKEALSLNAGTGTVSLQGTVGGTTALGALTLEGAIIDLAGNADLTTAGGAITAGAPVVLTGTGATISVIDTTQAGTDPAGAAISLVSVDGSLAGDQALTLKAGTGGTVSVQAGLGSQTALGAVTLGDAALDLDANAGITTFGGAVSQSGATLIAGGAATTIDTTDGGAAGGANIAFGTIDATAVGAQSLRFTAGTGTIALSGAAGGVTALGAVTLSDATLQIGANVSLTASGGAIDQTGATVLLGTGATSSVIQSNVGETFAGTIDGSVAGKQSLVLTGGVLSLGRSVGATTPLGTVSLDGTAIALGANVAVTTAGGGVSLSGAVAAAGPVTIDTTAGGTKPTGAGIVLASGFDGGALSLTAGSGGTITLDGPLGATTPLTDVTLTDAALDIGPGATIAIAGGPFSQTGATVLQATSAITTGAGTIAFAGTIDAAAAGAEGLGLNAGSTGAVVLHGNVGMTTPLGALSLTDGLLEIGPNVGITTAGGAVSNTGALVLLGGASAAASTIATNGGLAAAGANITLGGTIDGAVPGNQALTLDAGTSGTIALGGSVGTNTAMGAVTLSGAALLVPANFTLATFGGAVSETGAVILEGSGPTVAAFDTTDGGRAPSGANIALNGPLDGSIAGDQALTLAAGAGTIALAANLGGTTPLGAVTLSDGVLLIGANANITTAGGAVSETGATLVQAGTSDPAIDTTAGGSVPPGANVAFTGTIDAASPAAGSLASALGIDAGAGGSIALSATVGGRTPLAALTLTDAELDAAPNLAVTTIDTISQTGATKLLGGAQATVTTFTAALGSITFDGAIDASAPGRQALALNANTVLLQGNVGSRTPLGALTVTDAQWEIGANAAITTAGGAVTEVATAGLTALTTLLPNGTNPTLTVIDTTAGGTVAGGANITFANNIAGGSAGLQSLHLVAGSDGTIALAGSIGVNTALGSLSFTDALLTLGLDTTFVTAGGAAISQTGETLLEGGASSSNVQFNAGTVSFDGPVEATGPVRPALSIAAGTIGFGGNVGSATALAALALYDDTMLDLAPGLNLSVAGSFVQTGATILLAGAGPTSSAITAASISFSGPIDGGVPGAQSLTLNAGGGAITLGGSIGAATPLGTLTLSDAVLNLGATITTAGGAVSQSGATTLLGAATIDTTAGGAVPSGANVIFAGPIDGTSPGAQSLAINAGSGATIVLQSDVGARTALGAFGLGDAVLAVPAGFSVTTAGGPVSQTGATEVAGGSPTTLTIDTTDGGAVPGGSNIALGAVSDGAAGTLTLVLNAGAGGTVELLGNVGAPAALAGLILRDAGLVIGPNVSVTTLGTPFFADGATVLMGSGATASLATIDTTGRGASSGAAITFAGPINGGVAGEQSLALDAGSAEIAFEGTVGTTTALGALALGDSTLRLSSGGAIDTSGGPVSQSGATLLLASAAVSTGGGGIFFGGPIDGAASGDQALSLNAGGGTVSLPTNVGATVPLGGLALSGGAINLGGTLYQTVDGAIAMNGTVNFTAPMVLIAVVIPTPNLLPATTGAPISLSFVSAPTTTLTLDPGIDAASIGGGSLMKIAILEGNGSSLTNLNVGSTSLGGEGTATGMTVGGYSGMFASAHAFIRPGGVWTVNAGDVLITDPALAGLTNSVLSNEGVSTAIALMNQIQQLIARGDTGETAAQQAFLQSPDRPDYAIDPFRQRYNILGVAQENVGGFEDLSYVTDGFWEGILKK